MPKSQLQCYGEAIYCISDDMLCKCAHGKSSMERFTSVVAWSLSTIRPPIFGLAPFNPILGETHHVSKGTLNVLLEQVSHHPPVAVLHATDAEENLELIWCQNPVPRFHGTSIEALIHGKREVKLLGFGECYEMDAPTLMIKFFPVPSTEWAGNVSIRCKESGLEADLCYYKSHSFLGFGGNPRSVKGRIFHSKTSMTIYEIYGQWDRTVMLKDVHSGKVTTLYDAREAILELKTPTLKDPEGLLPTESAVVWAEVSEAILNRDWERAREAKRSIEERERKLQAKRNARGETWLPKYFNLEQTKDGEWECWPKQRNVPPAPIVVPS
uniref:Oxysterol-binding protein-related protein 4B n=1 Tax=Anthurium amnicola TaxID=1678845 RepID=A0A1D1ZIN3_9ARAE